METKQKPALRYLWHPATQDIFSGYGLVLGPAHLVGPIMIGHPTVTDANWLAEIEKTFGEYKLIEMTKDGEQGLLCQMHIVQESLSYLKTYVHPRTLTLRNALLPLLHKPPVVTLSLAWHQASHCWASYIVKGNTMTRKGGRC